MHRVATHVIEVRAGKVASYPGNFDEYVYRVQNEIDSGLRAPHATGPSVKDAAPSGLAARKPDARSDREAQKKLKAVERKIAKLDEEKRGISDKLLAVTEMVEATRLQAEMARLTTELAALEEEWLELSAELDSA
jgi:ATP-binding cassette subfamily F protein 3